MDINYFSPFLGIIYEISPIPHIFRLEMDKEVVIAVAPERPLSAVYDGG